MERKFDIFFAGTALLLLSPVLLLVMVVLRFSGEKEVFFFQSRIGLEGSKFNLLKFVTMLRDSPSLENGTVTVNDDPRVLPVGRLLRKLKINELPQLINVLLGEMSVVGPRPLTEETFTMYSAESQSKICRVKPGLSGIGSIIFRNEEELMSGDNSSVRFYASEIAPYKSVLEQWFVENKSMTVYFSVIFMTIWVIALPRSGVVWRIFRDLPKPPASLAEKLKYDR